MQLKNEAYLVEMAQIMDDFNQYIPSEESLQSLNVNGTDHMYNGDANIAFWRPVNCS